MEEGLVGTVLVVADTHVVHPDVQSTEQTLP